MIYVVLGVLLLAWYRLAVRLMAIERVGRHAALRAHLAEGRVEYLRRHLGPCVHDTLRRLSRVEEAIMRVEELGTLVALDGLERARPVLESAQQHANRAWVAKEKHDVVRGLPSWRLDLSVERGIAADEAHYASLSSDTLESLLVDPGATDVDYEVPQMRRWYGLPVSD